MADQIQIRRDTENNWKIVNPTLAQGEMGIELDDSTLEPQGIKIGNGMDAWDDLPYFFQTGGSVAWGAITGTVANQTDLVNYIINTLRSFSKPQWLDVVTLTAVSNVFTPDLGVSGSFTADIGANSTLANPTIPVGYDSGKVLAWDITFTITGAGGWTLAFGNQYFVDAGVDIATIISDNNTTGDKIQLFFQFKNNVISVQPFIPTAIP